MVKLTKPKHHIFVCASFRMKGDAQGVCGRKGAVPLIQYLESELSDRGLDDVLVSSTGCLKLCDHGPVMMIYPDNYWYGEVDEAAIDEILDALEEGKAAEDYLFAK
ncbi:ferredoxin [Hydrococcus rivularis NIES-593]|uniref:Ferredoxin n=1 Tax=Hydrococcus rivularis NIES-593 TaxID=1921803 RepID=A0A1U7HNM9_9CYAN|nr:(2Fe-2S) ferredoxin domain-containing protein [Hydrococcus rivularis]OKH25202.1 ferredoxin [Hydrococcus rivularis NIES-593]